MEMLEMEIEVGVVTNCLFCTQTPMYVLFYMLFHRVLQKFYRVGGHSYLTVEEIITQRDELNAPKALNKHWKRSGIQVYLDSEAQDHNFCLIESVLTSDDLFLYLPF